MQKFWPILFRLARCLESVRRISRGFSFFLIFYTFSLSGRFAIQRVLARVQTDSLARTIHARETRRCIMNNNRAHNIAEWKVARHGGCTALPLCRCSRRLSDTASTLQFLSRVECASSLFLLAAPPPPRRPPRVPHPPCFIAFFFNMPRTETPTAMVWNWALNILWSGNAVRTARGVSLSAVSLSLIQLYKASLRGRTTTLYCHLCCESSTPRRILTLLTVTTIPYPRSTVRCFTSVGYSTTRGWFLFF